MPDARLFASYIVAESAVPVLASAIHAGHDVRDGLRSYLALDDAARLREEDPYTAEWTACAPTRIVVHRSRFEVDVNRPRDSAVYLTPAEAWGLDVWREALPGEMVATSLRHYDDFYAKVAQILDGIVERHGGFVLLDLHSYNHRRGGADAAADDPEANPEVNLGTGTLDRVRFARVVDTFVADLAEAGFDVQENVKFRGGNLAAWIHERYPTGCVLAIEFKKTWMDEWTGERDARAHVRIAETLDMAVPHLAEAFGEVSV
jgi:N-formylglutamate amidohydrolase